MAKVYADRVLETSTSEGTDVFTLDGAVTGFRRFDAVMAGQDTFDYAIVAVDDAGNPTGEWEVGVGTIGFNRRSFSRAITAGSNGIGYVNFGPGLKHVFLTLSAVSINQLGGGGGVPDAPADGTLYGRQDAKWVPIPKAGGGGAVPRPIAFFFTTAPAAGETLLLYTAAEPITLAAAFAGSHGRVLTPPSAATSLSVRVNGTEVGTIGVATSGTVTFQAAAATQLAAGDLLQVVAPAAANGLANAAITLLGAAQASGA